MNRYRFIDEPDEKGKPRHLHTLDGEPLMGTSTVLGIIAKPLTWWASGLACNHLGWTNPKIPNSRKRIPMEDRLPDFLPRYNELICMSPEEFLKTLDEAYKAHSIKLDASAQAGTDMHYELESYVKFCLEFYHGIPQQIETYTLAIFESDPSQDEIVMHKAVKLFAEWAKTNVFRFIASEAYCYSEWLWTGGIIDLIYEDNDGKMNLLDFKSSKEAYFNYFLQNAGYHIALTENGILTKEGDLVQRISDSEFARYAVFPFGMEDPKPFYREDLPELQQGFVNAVGLYKLQNSGVKPSAY